MRMEIAAVFCVALLVLVCTMASLHAGVAEETINGVKAKLVVLYDEAGCLLSDAPKGNVSKKSDMAEHLDRAIKRAGKPLKDENEEPVLVCTCTYCPAEGGGGAMQIGECECHWSTGGQ